MRSTRPLRAIPPTRLGGPSSPDSPNASTKRGGSTSAIRRIIAGHDCGHASGTISNRGAKRRHASSRSPRAVPSVTTCYRQGRLLRPSALTIQSPPLCWTPIRSTSATRPGTVGHRPNINSGPARAQPRTSRTCPSSRLGRQRVQREQACRLGEWSPARPTRKRLQPQGRKAAVQARGTDRPEQWQERHRSLRIVWRAGRSVPGECRNARGAERTRARDHASRVWPIAARPP